MCFNVLLVLLVRTLTFSRQVTGSLLANGREGHVGGKEEGEPDQGQDGDDDRGEVNAFASVLLIDCASVGSLWSPVRGCRGSVGGRRSSIGGRGSGIRRSRSTVGGSRGRIGRSRGWIGGSRGRGRIGGCRRRWVGGRGWERGGYWSSILGVPADFRVGRFGGIPLVNVVTAGSCTCYESSCPNKPRQLHGCCRKFRRLCQDFQPARVFRLKKTKKEENEREKRISCNSWKSNWVEHERWRIRKNLRKKMLSIKGQSRQGKSVVRLLGFDELARVTSQRHSYLRRRRAFSSMRQRHRLGTVRLGRWLWECQQW